MKPNSPAKAIILDAFGTVIHPVPRHGPYHRVLSKAADFRAARSLALTLNGDLHNLAKSLGLPPIEEADLIDLAGEVEGLSPFEDTRPFLQQVKAAGYQVAICSNLGHAYGAKTKELLPEIDHFTFSYEVGYFKPDPRIYEYVCAGLRILPTDAIFIGDTQLADGSGPRQFGMNSEIIRRKQGDTLFKALDRALHRGR